MIVLCFIAHPLVAWPAVHAAGSLVAMRPPLPRTVCAAVGSGRCFPG